MSLSHNINPMALLVDLEGYEELSTFRKQRHISFALISSAL